MRKAKSFGVRGMSAEERRAANPYLGRKVPLHGVAPAGALPGRDEGLRRFMLDVYNLMFCGLAVTALAAFATYALTVTGDPAAAAVDAEGYLYVMSETELLTPLGVLLYDTWAWYVVCLGPLLLLVACAPVFRGLNATAALAVFALVATLIGVSFSALALSYTGASIVSVFLCTAAAFGGLSLVGYTTQRDLSGWGSFLWMGFFGLLVAAIVNLFLKSDAVQFAVCAMGVLVFSGFTVYDTQAIKEAYSERMGREARLSLAISGALDLYLDFVNLFRFLLFFLGEGEE